MASEDSLIIGVTDTDLTINQLSEPSLLVCTPNIHFIIYSTTYSVNGVPSQII